MKHAWFLDVLTDLRSFADLNGFDSVSEKLDDVQRTAEAEIAFLEGSAPSKLARLNEAANA